ncbi:MAG: 3-dehydroquinate synthase [Oscillospiraceae bacterium]|nr:3-dehydroquinate synthase [Oscillospiraceae bacterium]
MNTQILTTPDGESYPIMIGSGLMNQAGEKLSELTAPCRVMLISDTNVAPLYMERVVKSLEAAGFTVSTHVVNAGEESKSVRVLGEVLEAFAEAHLTRTDLALALGGGVVGDLTGFAAGCYLRGIRFMQMPTTLLSAVDASVGGKTAVNLQHGKNLAGLFHQPIAVICDTDALDTLTPHELADGAAEAIKSGILGDEALFAIYESGTPSESAEEIISRAVAYKANIVTQDPKEQGVRKLLNLGHTAAHAIEILSDFGISHGHAVAVGMAIVTRAAAKRGLLSQDACDRILCTLERSSLPVACPYTAAQMAKIAALDKKAAAKDITVILPEAIGRCRIEKMPIASLEALFADGLEETA